MDPFQSLFLSLLHQGFQPPLPPFGLPVPPLILPIPHLLPQIPAPIQPPVAKIKQIRVWIQTQFIHENTPFHLSLAEGSSVRECIDGLVASFPPEYNFLSKYLTFDLNGFVLLIYSLFIDCLAVGRFFCLISHSLQIYWEMYQQRIP